MKNIILYICISVFFNNICYCQVITTVAGGDLGHAGFWGDGGPATNAAIGLVGSIAVDIYGNIYMPNNTCRIRKVDASTGIISTIAGNGVCGFSGDGLLATNAELNGPDAITVDVFGNIYISELYRVRKIDAITGLISTVLGNGLAGDSGDNGPATLATTTNPFICTDTFGNLFVGDSLVIRKIDSFGIIKRIAGLCDKGCNGDGGPATDAQFHDNPIMAIDRMGNIYTSTIDTCVTVRKIDAVTGTITRVAGTDDFVGIPYSGDNIPATNCHIYPFGIAVDYIGNLFISDYENQRIEMVDTNGIIHTVAGTGVHGFSGDGGPATLAKLNYPEDVAVDGCGNIYIADFNNQRIRKVVLHDSCSSHPTGVKQITKASGLNIYPNPAQSILDIEAPEEINAIGIYDAIGREQLKLNTAGRHATIDIKSLRAGIYFVCVNGAVWRRFLKE